ncbi:MAG: hypothetical protein HYT80_07255 [Euryarchaeota archaeon]|nr:hypothetical protein [Euryarchaeota archaeon]
MRMFFAFTATTLLLAGCLHDGDGKDKDLLDDALGYLSYVSDEFPLELDHNHNDPSLHVDNFQVDFVAHHACTPDGKYPGAGVGMTDIAFWANYAFVGIRNGFCILDVSNPASPKFVSKYLGEPAADFEVSADGNFAFLLTQRNGEPVNRGSTDPTDHLPRGVIVVNVRNKASPQFESYYPVPTNGVHTAVPYKMGNRQLLSIQTYDWVPPGLPSPVPPVPPTNAPYTQRIEITELKAAPGGRMVLERVSMWSQDRPTPTDLWFPHDAYIQQHPVTGKTYLYAAYWDAGLIVLDISDPAKPAKVSQFREAAPSKYNAYHDVKVSEELIDGRHITVTGPELQAAVAETGHFRIFDTTDPAKPVQLGTWTLPGVPGFQGGFLFSPHVFQVVHGRIYLAHNHGGIWVIDIHNETLLKEPKAVGYYFPHGDAKDPKSWAQSASVWGAYYKDGYIYATETTQGMHVLKWVADEIVPTPAAMVAPKPAGGNETQ